jgi:hypothetical protein
MRRLGALARVAAVVGVVAAGGVVLGAPAASAAQARHVAVEQFSGERIASFDSRITVDPAGSIEVVETIDYDFGSTSHHGIDRYIPDRFPYDGPKPSDGRFDRVTPISDVSVSSPTGAPTDLDSSDDGGNLKLRIGDPDEVVSGRQTYVIRYRVRGVFNRFGDHDELYWNATGNDWSVTIDRATARVTAPGTISESTCYAGPTESRLTCAQHQADGSTATFAQQELAPGSGLTVVIGMPVRTVRDVAPILDELWTPQRAFLVNGGTLAGGIAVLLAGAAGIGALLYRNGRDRRYAGSVVDAAFGNESGEERPVPLFGKEVDTVEFVPPDGIRPGHMGTLWDEVANPLDVSAMIVDLAVRGYLRIDEIEAPSPGTLGIGRREGDYRFVRLKPPDGALLSAERVLLEGLFRDGETAQLSELRTQFAPRLQLVEGALYDDAVAAGWFPTRPDRVRARWHALGMVALVLGGAAAFLLIRFTRLGVVALPLPLLGLALLGLGSRFPRRTGKGTALLGRVRGFRELFEAGEGERQRFAESKQLFSQYLPYAIVFGMAERWAQTFEGLGLTPEEMGVGVWYTSPFGYNPLAFGYAMSSFSTVTTGSIAAAMPSTSASSGFSGFGGGGFSGGGFGGGGGGSW